MTQVPITTGANHFVATHAELPILAPDHIVIRNRVKEAWPTSPRFVLRRRPEESKPTACTTVDPFAQVIPVLILERAFGPFLT